MSNSASLEAWGISSVDYPTDSSKSEQLQYLVRYAILAPSSHNTQPWLFRINERAIEVHADRRRALPVIDPTARQLMMSCGAAIMNLRVALRRFGHTGRVQYFPDPHQPDLVARVSCGLPMIPGERDLLLFDAIPQRHTNRQSFALRPVSYKIADELSMTARDKGVWVERLSPEAKNELAELIAAADRAQFQDRAFRRELANWLSTRRSERRDGIPVDSIPDGGLRAEPMVVRTFDIGGSVAATEKELATGSPMLLILGTYADEPVDWVRGGEAMQQILLVARTHGVSASFLNQVLEIEYFRDRATEITGHKGYPQLVLRMGYGPPATPTPRRPLHEVLLA